MYNYCILLRIFIAQLRIYSYAFYFLVLSHSRTQLYKLFKLYLSITPTAYN